jgi:hypothetical protein
MVINLLDSHKLSNDTSSGAADLVVNEVQFDGLRPEEESEDGLRANRILWPAGRSNQ